MSLDEDVWAPLALDIEKSSYTAEEFFDWHTAGKLELSPDFQRGEVWRQPAKAFLIDTLLRGFPVPPIHLRILQRESGGLVRQVIDGQQRLTAVVDYLDGKYRLAARDMSGETPPWAAKRFSELSLPLRRRILDYSFRCEVYKGNVDDSLVREIFARINIHSVPLNDQELRNGRYFGEFKNVVYLLSREHAQLWLSAGIFTRRAIARMLDAQFVSEALVLQLAGQQDKKTSLDQFYTRYEQEWADAENHEYRFRTTIDAIRMAVGDIISDTAFKRVPLFYTLYAVVYHRLFGMVESHTDQHGLPLSSRAPLSEDDCARLSLAVRMLSDVVEGEIDDVTYRDFRTASARQTDNLRPRLVRFRILWEAAALG